MYIIFDTYLMRGGGHNLIIDKLYIFEKCVIIIVYNILYYVIIIIYM